MKKQSLVIIIIAFFIFAVNGIVFLSMSDYMKNQTNDFDLVMYYLAIIMMIGSGFVGYIGYRDLSKLNTKEKWIANIIFYFHMLSLAIFLGTIWYFIGSV